jgi:hypothetical protein
MTEQYIPPSADQELAQTARRPRWSGPKTVAVVVVSVGVLAAGGIAVYAASNSSSNTPAPVMPGGGAGGGPRGAGGGAAGSVMNALHGEFTISDGNGGYKTEIMQNGQVTAVSATSLTAKSADGYTKVYTINANTVFGTGTVSDIANGDTVTVTATPSGDQASADSVSERGQVPPGGQGGQGRQGIPPAGG